MCNTTKEHLNDLAYFPPLQEKRDYLPLMIVNSGPDAAWKSIRNLYFALVNGAQDHIFIQSPFFILDDGLAEAFASAARAGIEVKVMVAPDGPDGGFAYRAGYYTEIWPSRGEDLPLPGRLLSRQNHYGGSAICSIGWPIWIFAASISIMSQT
jgi:cardiolipin synthase